MGYSSSSRTDVARFLWTLFMNSLYSRHSSLGERFRVSTGATGRSVFNCRYIPLVVGISIKREILNQSQSFGEGQVKDKLSSIYKVCRTLKSKVACLRPPSPGRLLHSKTNIRWSFEKTKREGKKNHVDEEFSRRIRLSCGLELMFLVLNICSWSQSTWWYKGEYFILRIKIFFIYLPKY